MTKVKIVTRKCSIMLTELY